jgi:hypothetical protein
VRRRARAGRAVPDRTWSGACDRDELGEGPDSNMRSRDENVRLVRERGDRGEVFEWVEWEIEGEPAAYACALVLTSTVRPSAAEPLTKAGAAVLPAPGRFTTVTGSPQRFASGPASARPTRSGPPPAPNGSISRTGPPGNAFAAAGGTVEIVRRFDEARRFDNERARVRITHLSAADRGARRSAGRSKDLARRGRKEHRTTRAVDAVLGSSPSAVLGRRALIGDAAVRIEREGAQKPSDRGP